MKFQVTRDVLADAVAWTARTLPGRPAVPALSGILLDALDGGLTLSAFDYDVSARASIEADVAEPGTTLIPGRVLAEITKSLPDQPVQIATSGSEVMLTCGGAEFGLLTMPVEDFPTLPAMPEKAGAVGGGVFAAAVGQVAVAASRDASLPVLTGVRVDIDGDVVSLAATDRYRIAAREFLWSSARPEQRAAVIVPAKVMVEVGRTLRAGEVSIGLGEGIAGFECADRVTTVRLLDDQFKDYRSRLTDDLSIRAGVTVAPFVEAVKRVALVAEHNSAIRLSFTQGQVLIQAGGGEIGRGAEAVAAELDGEDIQIAFQPHYLLDGLAGVETENARLHLASPTRPVLITDDADDPAFRYLVMSLRLG
ncbi:DNA polymerase III subunit beta [Sphaerisporangium krabiense]|uniref:Beta sliding clamp n=1 Tax=Sphaerisporangium krabiense TaxID=763782 RepID=A0A7W8Z362_9ACTN|nr:DNA polymerase III subunit beta [Sphaerisporangium krabiense]MBB5626385.1 DNA polymerase-3 subunit beta [Sphaerisporangium krabiense]GII63303.1 DNA polymerase III subunit beta [Sphaerisporangium krabiense]